MNKTEMLTLLESRLGSRSVAVAALDAVLDEIQHAVASGERVTLTGFGTFERVERPARIGRNPRTGTAIEIPAAATPRFHAGSVLRAAVAGPAPSPRTRAVRTTSATTTRATTAGKVAATPARDVAGKPAAKATTAAAKLAKAPKPAKAVKPAKATKPPKAAKPAKATKPPKDAKATKKSTSGKPAKSSGSKKKK